MVKNWEIGWKGIGKARNYYGGVVVKCEDNKFFWGIENWDEINWEEIPKYLYDALIKFEDKK